MSDIDNHKLMYHPERVLRWDEKGDCFPIYVEIGPTNKCNHKCIFCALDWTEHNKADISKEVMVSALEDIASNGVKSVMFAGEGEPLIHKNISEFVKTAKTNGLDVSITTNGVLFNKEKAEEILPYLSWIRFSLDAGTQETYSEIHKCKKEDFNKVIENIKYASELKHKKNLKTTIGVQYLLMPQNIEEVIKATSLIKKTGADNIQIKPYSKHPFSINKFVINYQDYFQLESELEKFNTEKFKVLFRKQTIQRLSEKIDYKQCYGLHFFTLIDAKGNMIPCNLFYGNQEFTYGNLNENSFSEIWESKKRKKILEKLIEKGIGECREICRLDPINKYLYRLKNPNQHDNFI